MSARDPSLPLQEACFHASQLEEEAKIDKLIAFSEHLSCSTWISDHWRATLVLRAAQRQRLGSKSELDKRLAQAAQDASAALANTISDMGRAMRDACAGDSACYPVLVHDVWNSLDDVDGKLYKETMLLVTQQTWCAVIHSIVARDVTPEQARIIRRRLIPLKGKEEAQTGSLCLKATVAFELLAVTAKMDDAPKAQDVLALRILQSKFRTGPNTQERAVELAIARHAKPTNQPLSKDIWKYGDIVLKTIDH